MREPAHHAGDLKHLLNETEELRQAKAELELLRQQVEELESQKLQTPEPAALAAPLEAAPAVPAAKVPEVLERELPEPMKPRSSEGSSDSKSASLQVGELIRPESELKRSIEAFLLDQRSEHTRRAYGKDLKRFIQFLLLRGLDKGSAERLDRSVVIAYKEHLLTEKLQHTSVDRHLATLRSFFRWLVDDGVIEKSPAEGVRFLSPKKVSPTQGFSDEEVRKVLQQPNLHRRTGALHYAILMVLFYCGLRRSELCELKVANLGEERGHRFIRLRGKGNAERIIVMKPQVWNAIRHYFLIAGRSLNAEKDVPLFMPVRNNRTGAVRKHMDPSMIFYIVTRYAKLAGVTNQVSPHSCRATAISNARDQNVPDRAIQEFAGWASPDMITRYDKRKTTLEKSAAHAIHYGLEDSRVDPYLRIGAGASTPDGSPENPSEANSGELEVPALDGEPLVSGESPFQGDPEIGT